VWKFCHFIANRRKLNLKIKKLGVANSGAGVKGRKMYPALAKSLRL
jgi:hypothetical protein